jgi:hypothetical protein
MRTFVLGAGASWHAGYPLISGFWEKLKGFVETNYPIDHEERILIQQAEAFGDPQDFEALLSNIDEVARAPRTDHCVETRVIASDLRHQLRRIVCNYFDSLRRNRAEAYAVLASKLLPLDTIVTFNYDVSLDRELRGAGKWDIETGYGFRVGLSSDESPVRLLKLHGSTNWTGAVFGGSGSSGAHEFSSLGSRPAIAPSELQFLGYDNLSDPQYAAGPHVSALIMPTQQKQFHETTSFGCEWQGFWKILWDSARNALQRSHEVFIIGYRLSPTDHDARDLLTSGPGRSASITVCCLEDSELIKSELLRNGYRAVTAVSDMPFEDWIKACAL